MPIARSGVAVYAVKGWHDAGYARAGLRRFVNAPRPQRLTIGPWGHGAGSFYAPGVQAATKAEFRLVGEMLRFFDRRLKGVDTGIDAEPRVHYFTTGVDEWRRAARWPVRSTAVSWCLAAGASLDPNCAGDAGVDAYRVDREAGTGDNARWNTSLGGLPVYYSERSSRDAKLLTYTSPALAADTEVTGEAVLQLQLAADAPDTPILAYLEDVGPDGRSFYVTEGILRASQRALGWSGYRTLTPIRPDAPDALTVSLLPTSHVFKAGHRIRIALAGADVDHFGPGADGVPWRVHQGGIRSSRIVLPIVAAPPPASR